MRRFIGEITWNSKWVCPFDSPWTIIEKIKYANALSTSDLLGLIGTEYVRPVKSNINARFSDLFTLEGIDDMNFKQIFSFSLSEHNQSMINLLTDPIYDGKNNLLKYFYPQLYFCPQCITQGFHSLLHQFKLINICPFHQIPLVKSSTICCGNSENNLQYRINFRNKLNSFQCNCGNTFSNFINPYRPKWYQPTLHKIKYTELKEWMLLPPVEKKIITSSLFFVDKKETNDNSYTMIKNLLKTSKNIKNNFIHTKDLRENHTTVKKLNALNFPIKTNQSSLKYYGFGIKYNEIIFQETKTIINCTARKLRKEIYSKHKHCLIRMKKNLHSRNCCPIAKAYLQWRYAIQGFDQIYDVDNSQSYSDRLYKRRLDYANHVDREFLYLLTDDLNSMFEITDLDNVQEFIKLLKRLVYYLAINYFNYILEQLSLGKADIPDLVTHGDYIEPFIIEVPIVKGGPFVFHSWGERATINIDYQKICPSKTTTRVSNTTEEINKHPLKDAIDRI
ncbi:hypothetical protein AJ85_16775 [Alkalihalobacillus alcalophilus ATCC 27647 = CGMCC 1.3604]|uniref:Uncharacterized protein n=1 Tax=Alkalihalobacillus alcalophilus ATCC 27647 = CGMCC 1.3604 TaxID=1218173 RepID=A0A094XBW9_ALKAL|nr:hypothetical protein [Alkalihalobacillus alcalophilus]KGA96265.1 hypothetical protein BALCAV_0217275 [Alkalihalobacillus alcalophilus ATCC 27647 = CGMCC 1.3604]MED1563599.1 hypothetical protein [Alkalihalobacillus alcalophilus]THG89562.1 hypothetical protein AJ85_16775 [Alkalihalobacillus alcalophilus ATCC 27647 = CGMCC 1.3604]